MIERNRAGGKGQDTMQRTINLTKECHNAGGQMIMHCLTQGGEHAKPAHMRLLIDCAQICATCTDFMLRESDYHRQTCAVCSEVCDACAESCGEFRDEQEMQNCARTCRECADECRKMAAA